MLSQMGGIASLGSRIKNRIPACFLVPYPPLLLFQACPHQQPAGSHFLDGSGHKSIHSLTLHGHPKNAYLATYKTIKGRQFSPTQYIPRQIHRPLTLHDHPKNAYLAIYKSPTQYIPGQILFWMIQAIKFKSIQKPDSQVSSLGNVLAYRLPGPRKPVDPLGHQAIKALKNRILAGNPLFG